MASKKDLVSRIDYIKSLIESKGHTFNYNLPKNFKKEDLLRIENEARSLYKIL
jgi:hypothetical protein